MTHEQFKTIKDQQTKGASSKDVSKELNLGLAMVNHVFGCNTWDTYIEEHGTLAQRQAHAQVSPARAGYYRALIATKVEENGRLKESQEWLVEQIAYLRKAVRFLENRKAELERGIAALEKNVYLGVEIMTKLERDDRFNAAVEADEPGTPP